MRLFDKQTLQKVTNSNVDCHLGVQCQDCRETTLAMVFSWQYLKPLTVVQPWKQFFKFRLFYSATAPDSGGASPTLGKEEGPTLIAFIRVTWTRRN